MNCKTTNHNIKILRKLQWNRLKYWNRIARIVFFENLI
jgi:hypothetical protein